MAESNLGLLFRINADPSQAQGALEGFRGKTTEQMESIRSEFKSVQKGQADWSSGFLSDSSAVSTALLTLSQAATVTFDQLAGGLAKNISTALVYSQSMTEALEKTLKSTAASIASEAILQALRSAAMGFYLLAVGDFAGAGSAFESAALWGTIGGVAAGVGAAVGGGQGGGGASNAGSGRGGYSSGSSGLTPPSGVLAPGAAPSAAPGGNLTVSIMGDTDAAHWLANTLNQGVSRGVQLTATRTQRSPYAGG
ncbi:MAG TPA: hypothetical protein VG206_11145 [Terriglobia bacterium]|nr:hypothetical protein [Terriglobia bacterium]